MPKYDEILFRTGNSLNWLRIRPLIEIDLGSQTQARRLETSSLTAKFRYRWRFTGP
jgi:hypothetical protein